MSDTTLRNLVHGKGTHVDPVACVEDVTAEQALHRVAGFPHSIWQIVEHMNYWMDYDLRTVAGDNPPYPNHAIESWAEHPDPANDEQWKAATRRFGELLARIAALADGDSAELERSVTKLEPLNSRRQSTMHASLWEVAAHNSYHSGQIALLRRQAGAWPPERGGDTW